MYPNALLLAAIRHNAVLCAHCKQYDAQMHQGENEEAEDE